MGGLAWTDKASASQRVTWRGHREGSLFPDSRRCLGEVFPARRKHRDSHSSREKMKATSAGAALTAVWGARWGRAGE